MRLFLQILFFIFTCFTSSVLTIDIGTAPKIVVPTNTSIFQKTEKTIHSEKAKIGLEIPKAFGIGRSSIASLSGSYLQDDYPDLANVLNITSSILAITDLSANGVDILLKANTNPSAAIDIISESEDVLDATAHIEHVEVLLDRITAPSPDPQVLAVLNSSNPKTKDFLVDILEAEKHSAKGADRMDIVNKIDEAIEVVSGAVSVFNVGDNIIGKVVQRVRPGTNGKIAVIGRQMKDHVNDVAAHLKNNQGYQVEILSDVYLNRTFNIDGVEWTVNSAWDDMVENPAYNYMKDPVTNYITAEYIEQIPMYKLNKQWIEYIKSEGFTIIDIGYPIGVELDPSLFYNMEINTINW